MQASRQQATKKNTHGLQRQVRRDVETAGPCEANGHSVQAAVAVSSLYVSTALRSMTQYAEQHISEVWLRLEAGSKVNGVRGVSKQSLSHQGVQGTAPPVPCTHARQTASGQD